jgi:hypothetical protein
VPLQFLALDGIHSAPPTLETNIPRGELLTKPQCFEQANFAGLGQSVLAASQLRRLLEMGEVTVAPVIVQEVLQGAVDAEGFSKLRTYFTALRALSPTQPARLSDRGHRR